MRFLSVWEQGDALGCHVCLLLSPPAWCALRAVHRRMGRRLDATEVRWLFARRLQDRLTCGNGLSYQPLPEEPEPADLASLLALSSSVDCLSEVLKDVVAYPQLVAPGLGPLRQALLRLHRLALRNAQLMPRERSGRRPSLPRRAFRCFAGLSGILPQLIALLATFPASSEKLQQRWGDAGKDLLVQSSLAMPPAVFVVVCEVLASLIHNAKESKRTFVGTGGLTSILSFLRSDPDDANTQAAGLAVLLALSARSALCIRLMVEAGTHELAARALHLFPDDGKVVARATGLLANMSNVPCVCQALQRCGVLALAKNILSREIAEESAAHSPPLAEEEGPGSQAAGHPPRLLRVSPTRRDYPIIASLLDASGTTSSPWLTSIRVRSGDGLTDSLADAPSSLFVREFVQYLVSNLQEHQSAA